MEIELIEYEKIVQFKQPKMRYLKSPNFIADLLGTISANFGVFYYRFSPASKTGFQEFLLPITLHSFSAEMIEKRLHQKQVIFQGIFITDFRRFLLPKKQESQTDEFKVATAKTQQSG